MVVDIFTTDRKYDVIYADPPWKYTNAGTAKSSRGNASKHYSTMTINEICELPVDRIASDRAVCFMWTTFPQYPEALKVMKAWGFMYMTAGFVWVKKNKHADSFFMGMGQYTRTNAEVCLFGKREGVKRKDIVKSRCVRQLIVSPVEKHSKKPDETRDRIVELVGDIPRIELFARQTADGWDAWGNEV